MKQLLLIDGDELVYKAGFASQKVEYTVYSRESVLFQVPNKAEAIERIGNSTDDSLRMEPTIIIHPQEIAMFSLYSTLTTILEANPHNDYRIYFSGEDNFRKEYASLLPYKGNRSEVERPFHFNYIKSLLFDEYGAEVVPGIEADDALSIMQWQTLLSKNSWETTIVSQDKDLRMVPGWHYNPTRKERFFQDTQSAKYCFYKQLLTGDSTDNIPGIYRLGEKTAEKILDPIKHLPEKDLNKFVLGQYQKAENTPKIKDKMPGDISPTERMKEVGVLLWMLQERGQIWCPEGEYYQNVKC